MKKTFRKILHGVLDLLPITIIGVFAIYVQRHEPNQSITYAQNQIVNVNQQIKNGNFADNSHWDIVDGTALSVSNNVATFTATQNGGRLYNVSTNRPLLNTGHKYKICCDIQLTTGTTSVYVNYTIGNGSNSHYTENTTNKQHFDKIFMANDNIEMIITIRDIRVSDWDAIKVSNIMVIDLTQALGVEKANYIYDLETETAGAGVDYFNNTYKDYPLEYNADGTPTLFKNVSEVTYSNTDIGSQMVYSLYKPINDYFNLNNVANFEQVYDFFQVQFFNGNAPVSIFIIWNIILYQFIMDLIFLVYMVFMFIIDFIEGMLDFMFRKSFGGAK